MAKMQPVGPNTGIATSKPSGAASPVTLPAPIPPENKTVPVESKDLFAAAFEGVNLPPQAAAIAIEGAKVALLRTKVLNQILTVVDKQHLDAESANTLIASVNSYQSLSELDAFAQLWPGTIVPKNDGAPTLHPLRLSALVSAIATAVQIGTIQDVSNVKALLEEVQASLHGAQEVRPEAAARLNQALEAQALPNKWASYIYDPEEIRNEFEQTVIDAMMRNPSLVRAFPQVKQMARQLEQEIKATHLANTTKLDPEHPYYFETEPYAKPTWQIGQERGREVGQSQIGVSLKDDDTLNAYVFQSDQNNLDIIIHKGLIKNEWDAARNDFVRRDSLGDNKYAKTGTGVDVGARSLGAIISHELGHVLDQATDYRHLLSLMLQNIGINVFDPKASSREIPPSLMSTVEAFGQQIARATLKKEPTDTDMAHMAMMFAEMNASIEKTQPLDPEGAIRTLREIALSFPETAGLVQTGPMAQAETGGLLEMVSQFLQAQENTADHWAQVVDGTSFWTSLVFEKAVFTHDVDAALALDQNQVADDLIERTAKFNDITVRSSDNAQGSHRYNGIRIKDGAGYCAVPDGVVAQVRELKSLPADQRAFAMLQLFQRRLEPLEYAVENEPDIWNRPHALEGWVERSGTVDKINEINRANDALGAVVLEELKKDGLGNTDNPTFTRLISFLMGASTGEKGALIGQGVMPARFLKALSNELGNAMASTSAPMEKLIIGERKKLVDRLVRNYQLDRETSKREHDERAKASAAMRKAMRQDRNDIPF